MRNRACAPSVASIHASVIFWLLKVQWQVWPIRQHCDRSRKRV
jgi:hypothetical protein